MPKLYVAMYRPAEGNYEHWGLYLDTVNKIYEVIGESPHFKPNVVSGKPESTSRFRRKIFVHDINAQDMKGFQTAIAAVKADNEMSHWNCQDYVMEVLEKLEEECIIDEDDKAYVAAKRQIKKHYGPL